MVIKLTPVERSLIENYLSYYQALERGEDPERGSKSYSRELRERFRAACKGEKKLDNVHEIAYTKWEKLNKSPRKNSVVSTDRKNKVFREEPLTLSPYDPKYIPAKYDPLVPQELEKKIAEAKIKESRTSKSAVSKNKGVGRSKKKIFLNKGSSKHCPRCEKKGRGIFPLVQRQRKRSDPLWDLSTNRFFIGCSNFPNCRYIISPDTNNTL